MFCIWSTWGLQLGIVFLLLVQGCSPGFRPGGGEGVLPPFNQPSLPPPSNPIPPSLEEDVSQALKTPLLWSSDRNPERQSWSEVTLTEIGKHFATLDEAQDTQRFCPPYHRLSRSEKINFWGQLIAAISFYESSWNPRTRFHETTMGIDPVTQLPVYSEGLLQLSYQDIRWAPWCEFDWDRDRHLPSDSPQKTILNPLKNLRCGIGILSRQIQRRGFIVLSRGAYWAVIKEDSRFQKIDQIRQMIQRTRFCSSSQ